MKTAMKFVMAFVILLTMVTTVALAHEHEFGNYKIKKPSTCQKEGIYEMSCIAKNCGMHKTGKIAIVPHNFSINATCESPQKCSYNCGAIQGSVLGHKYNIGNCINTSKCIRCSKDTGQLGSHSFSKATCTSLSTCKYCKQTTGILGKHTFSKATCTLPS